MNRYRHTNEEFGLSEDSIWYNAYFEFQNVNGGHVLHLRDFPEGFQGAERFEELTDIYPEAVHKLRKELGIPYIGAYWSIKASEELINEYREYKELT